MLDVDYFEKRIIHGYFFTIILSEQEKIKAERFLRLYDFGKFHFLTPQQFNCISLFENGLLKNESKKMLSKMK